MPAPCAVTSCEWPLNFVAMGFPGPLPKTLDGHQFVLMIMDLYSKQMRAVPSSNTLAFCMASLRMDNWIIVYYIPTYVLMDNRTHLVSKLFHFLCAFIGTKHLTTTVHHPQTNGHAERSNKTYITGI